jgi:hypothetical protein
MAVRAIVLVLLLLRMAGLLRKAMPVMVVVTKEEDDPEDVVRKKANLEVVAAAAAAAAAAGGIGPVVKSHQETIRLAFWFQWDDLRVSSIRRCCPRQWRRCCADQSAWLGMFIDTHAHTPQICAQTSTNKL